MPKIWVARKASRKGLLLPMKGVSQNPSLLFPLLQKTDQSELDELVRAELEKQGITKESDVNAVVEQAERGFELREKTAEARQEFHRLMQERLEGKTLMQVGHRKWRPAYFMRTK
jgi:hypothetical protein